MLDDRRERERHRIFTRRAFVVVGGQLTIAGLLGARLYRLQVVENEAYRTLAENNRIRSENFAPDRGEIFDVRGRPLAVNVPNYMVRFVRERADDWRRGLSELNQILALSERDLDRLRDRIERERAYVPVLVRENLDWETFARINANAPALPFIEPDVGSVRFYPEAKTLAHVIGYVGAVTEEELARDRTRDPMLRLPDARIGKTGVEKSADVTLRGAAGTREIEINAGGRELREISRVAGAPGSDLSLTIDLDLQRYVMERIAGESAAVVVMDTLSGDLLSLVSGPAYDPNKFVFGISQSDMDDYNGDQYAPLRNKALAGSYPPGSTFKMITALAALESGDITPRTQFSCSGRLLFGDRYFHCWRRQGHGRLRMADGLKHSCDVYFYEAAKAAGIDRIADVAGRFGLGEAPQIDIPNVLGGVMPSTTWARSRGRSWSGGETLISGIGQGAVLATPLQLAVMAARIANGAEKVQPRLIKAVNGEERVQAPFEPLNVSAEGISVVREGMWKVSNESGGTAFGSRIDDAAHALCGKTGTSQVYSITEAERAEGVRSCSDLPWRLRDHALFVAYAPAEAPRYAICVVVEHGCGGSRAAAPIARDVMMRVLYGPEPPLEAYPPHIRPEIERARQAADQARATGADPMRVMT